MLELVADLGIIYMLIVLKAYKNTKTIRSWRFLPIFQKISATEPQCIMSQAQSALARICPPDLKCMVVIMLESKQTMDS